MSGESPRAVSDAVRELGRAPGTRGDRTRRVRQPSRGWSAAAWHQRPRGRERWVKGLLEREQLPMPLPTSLALRREVADLPQTLADVPDESTVRDIIEDLNRRIRGSHRRRVDGPPIVVKPVDVEQTVTDWRRSRSR